MVQQESNAKWIWFPGDFEIYHGMLQNFQREERGYGWPAYWKMDDWRKNVKFYKKYNLDKPTTFVVEGLGIGHVCINHIKYPFLQPITCQPGEVLVEIFIGNMTALPAVYIEGDIIYSDESWMVDDFLEEQRVGMSLLYQERKDYPDKVHYLESKHLPEIVSEVAGGVLFDFNKVINGTLELLIKTPNKKVTVCYGESKEEACDLQWCYYKQDNVDQNTVLRRRAFRFIYIPECHKSEVDCLAIHQYLPLAVKAKFKCNDQELNKIWEVSKETFCLCSELFFIDGIKRDRWIWSGDAYQSYFVNPYLLFDEEIDKRTILALRGNNDINQHINTIVDYSLLWLISIEKEYQITGDREFVRLVYSKMESLMKLCLSQLDEQGFIYGRKRDWIFVDWSDMDKEGTVCAEQILLLKCYDTMQFCQSLLGMDNSLYLKRFEHLKNQIMKYFWCEEKGAFIDCYQSGKCHVTRHANIFAILFDLVDQQKIDQIIKNVINNDEITKITTPYFKFFELDVLGKTGYLDQVLNKIKEYWGGMLKKGALTFWEEFDVNQDSPEQYSMYGDPFGKSLCHAWGASPIYLLGKYFLGVSETEAGYGSFVVEPHLEFFDELDCVVPVKDGQVFIKYKDKKLNVRASREGGILKYNGKKESILVND